MGRERVDVVIVGAGLTAARQLTRAGRSVVVLEARDGVGGRFVCHAPSNRTTRFLAVQSSCA